MLPKVDQICKCASLYTRWRVWRYLDMTQRVKGAAHQIVVLVDACRLVGGHALGL